MSYWKIHQRMFKGLHSPLKPSGCAKCSFCLLMVKKHGIYVTPGEPFKHSTKYLGTFPEIIVTLGLLHIISAFATLHYCHNAFAVGSKLCFFFLFFVHEELFFILLFFMFLCIFRIYTLQLPVQHFQ